MCSRHLLIDIYTMIHIGSFLQNLILIQADLSENMKGFYETWSFFWQQYLCLRIVPGRKRCSLLLVDTILTQLFCCSYTKGDKEHSRFFNAEMKPRIKHKKKGSISMVNNGSLEHASQVQIYNALAFLPSMTCINMIKLVICRVPEFTEALSQVSLATSIY